MAFDWKKTLSQVAPTIAGVIGTAVGGPIGPLAALAVKTLSEHVLGKPDGTPEEVAAAVAAMPPEKVAELRLAEVAFRTRALELGYKTEELDVKRDEIVAADRASARSRDIEIIKAGRKNERGDNLAYLAVVGLLGAALLLFFVDISQSQKEVLIFILGVLSKIVGDVYAFEFGSSKGEQKKDNAMTKWLDESDGA